MGKFPMAYSFFYHIFNTFAYKLNKLECNCKSKSYWLKNKKQANDWQSNWVNRLALSANGVAILFGPIWLH